MITTKKSTKTKSANQAVKKLYRSNTNKFLGGVCAGLGEFFSIDPIIIRVFFILLTLFGGGGMLIYIILWLIIPSSLNKSEVTEDSIKKGANEIQEKVQDFAQDIKNYSKEHSGKRIFGIVLIVIGMLFLISNLGLFNFHFIWKFWPILLIIIAIGLISKND